MIFSNILNFPASTWLHAFINVCCVVFAFAFIRKKRFRFLSYGFVSEWSFQAFAMFSFFLFFNIVFGIRVEVLKFSSEDSLDFQKGDMFSSAVFAFFIFAISWYIERAVWNKRRN